MCGLRSIKGLPLLKEEISLEIASCKRRGKPFGHTLITGIGGTGKTFLARCVSNELGYLFFEKEAASFRDRKGVISWLVSCDNISKSKGITAALFIDEAHRLYELQEVLYYPMVEHRITSATEDIRFRPFTLFAATTHPQKLSGESFLTRFANEWEIPRYDQHVLKELIGEFFDSHGLRWSWLEVTAIASRSLGIPRIAKKLALKVVTKVDSRGGDEVLEADVVDVFRVMGIDDLGLTELHRKYLSVLGGSNGRPRGVKMISGSLGKSPEEIEDRIEPILLGLGLIDHTAQGRILTDKGRQRIAISC